MRNATISQYLCPILLALAFACQPLSAQDVFTIADCDVKPQILKTEEPRLPPSVTNREGTVRVKLVINKEGHAVSVEVASSTNPELEEYALESVRHWEFSPAQREGVAVAVMTVVPVRFRTKG